jgi:hypothetical protein
MQKMAILVLCRTRLEGLLNYNRPADGMNVPINYAWSREQLDCVKTLDGVEVVRTQLYPSNPWHDDMEAAIERLLSHDSLVFVSIDDVLVPARDVSVAVEYDSKKGVAVWVRMHAFWSGAGILLEAKEVTAVRGSRCLFVRGIHAQRPSD